MTLTRDQILAADDAPREAVDVPEWGGSAFVRVMNGAARDAFEARLLKSPGQNVRAALAVACLCDESGAPLFAEADIPALGAKSGAALHRVFEAAARLNRITRGDVEELEKNS